MSKARNILGIVTGAILIVSSGAHAFLGWRSLREQLVGSGAPPDLVMALGIGWNFAGFSMFIFGVLLLLTFIPRLRGLYQPLITARVIGYSYAIVGAAAYTVSKSIFFINVFLVPGILILIASSERDEE